MPKKRRKKRAKKRTIEKRFRKISNSKKILVCITPPGSKYFRPIFKVYRGVFQMVSTIPSLTLSRRGVIYDPLNVIIACSTEKIDFFFDRFFFNGKLTSHLTFSDNKNVICTLLCTLFSDFREMNPEKTLIFRKTSNFEATKTPKNLKISKN